MREIERVRKFVGSLTSEQFEADELKFYATVRCLEIISEASRRLPEDLKSRYPEIEWRSIAGAGNVYRHDYDEVVPKLIWRTVKEFLPPLRDAASQELGSTNA